MPETRTRKMTQYTRADHNPDLDLTGNLGRRCTPRGSTDHRSHVIVAVVPADTTDRPRDRRAYVLEGPNGTTTVHASRVTDLY